MKRIRFLCFLTVLSVLFFFASAPLSSQAAAGTSGEKQTVKIGYYYDSDYFYKDGNSSYGGYDMEYFYEVSKYTDWQYQYVDFDSFEDAYAALEAGKIDIMPSLFYTKERAASLLLSSSDMGSVYVTIIVPPSNNNIAYNDCSALAGKKVGILSDSVDGEEYRAWAKEQGLDTDIVSMPTTEELLRALDSGDLSAVAISYLGSSSTYRIIKEFSPMKMYFGMPKDRTELMKQLNQALEEITIETPDFAGSLYSKYYIANQKQAPVFTADEKNYIASHGAFTVGVQNSDAPFSYVGKDGRMTGAIADYFERISQISGLQFSLKGYDTAAEITDAVKKGETDIAGCLVYDAAEATTDNLYLTNSYIDLALTEVALKGTGQIYTIAVPVGLKSVVQNGLSGSGASVVFYDNAGDCAAALHRGKADAAVINTYYANYYMNNDRADTYNITALNGFSYRTAAGVSASADKTLLSILNRCIRYSNATTMNELLTKYTQENASSFKNVLNRIPAAWLFGFAMIMCCFVIVLVLLYISVNRRQKEQTAMAARQSEVERKAMEIAAVEKAAEEKNAFFSNISHDMRTPLNAVIGFMRMSKKQGISEEERNRYVDKAILSGNLLLDLVDDTLTVSKANSGKLVLHPEPVRSRELFESIITPIRQVAAKKNITFTADDSAARDRMIMADKLGVQKIFLNLLSNAVKYTPEGGHVSLRVYNESTPDGDINSLLEVRDDGIGMSEEFMQHMYEPFTQEKRHGYESVGTGLGLSIVRQLVNLMGGSIRVKSEAGHGTVFTVCLHFAEVKTAPADKTKPVPDDHADLTGKKVLLCEDNRLNCEIALALLRDRKMTVTTAENGQIALQIFSGSAVGEYDVILMDVRMPVMDGIEATKAIRALDRPDAKTVPVLAMTADAFADDVQKCLDAGMNGHIAKPVDPETMYRTLIAAMSR